MTEELKLELIRKKIKDYKLLPVKDMYKAFPCFYRVDESQLSLVDDYIAKRTIKDEFGTNEEYVIRLDQPILTLGIIREGSMYLYTYDCPEFIPNDYVPEFEEIVFYLNILNFKLQPDRTFVYYYGEDRMRIEDNTCILELEGGREERHTFKTLRELATWNKIPGTYIPKKLLIDRKDFSELNLQLRVDKVIKKMESLTDGEYWAFIKKHPYFKVCIFERVPVAEILHEIETDLQSFLHDKDIEEAKTQEPLVRIELNLINKQLKDLNDRKDELLRKLRWYSSLLPNKNVTLDDIYDEDL